MKLSIRNKTLQLLIIAFIFTALHLTFHNEFDHQHDSNCSVYVLEELFFSADILDVYALLVLFIPFTVLSFTIVSNFYKAFNQFSIRAPPLFLR
jgi:DMSO/TMAO reductase YedYZ heme-binding membrane subunit